MDTNGPPACLLDPPIDPALIRDGQNQPLPAPGVTRAASPSTPCPKTNTTTPPRPHTQISGLGGGDDNSLEPALDVGGARIWNELTGHT
ncbi:hypothetical protein HYDPIDRAFT_108108, partial [Hydnomerulius pinastri MD-312]